MTSNGAMNLMFHPNVIFQVEAFKTQHYQHAIKLYLRLENKHIIFNARNDDDKVKFKEDLQESVREVRNFSVCENENS